MAFCTNDLANAVSDGDAKVEFLICLANWLRNYTDSRCSLHQKQPFDALITSLFAQAHLTERSF